MITKKDIEKDINDMTMKELTSYVENLKSTIYSLVEILEMVESTNRNVSYTIDAFHNELEGKPEKPALPVKEEKTSASNLTSKSSSSSDDNFILEAIYKNEIEDYMDAVILSNDDEFFIRSNDYQFYNEIKDGIEYLPNLYVKGNIDDSFKNEKWIHFLNTIGDDECNSIKLINFVMHKI